MFLQLVCNDDDDDDDDFLIALHINYTVSQKRPTFDFLSLLHTRLDCNNFWQNVAEKVGNQNILYFPTSPN